MNTTGLAVRDILISADFPYESPFADFFGSRIHYIDEGQGELVFSICGTPTSFQFWCKLISYL